MLFDCVSSFRGQTILGQPCPHVVVSNSILAMQRWPSALICSGSCEQDWLKHFDVLPALFPSGLALRAGGLPWLVLEHLASDLRLSAAQHLASAACSASTREHAHRYGQWIYALQNARLLTHLFPKKLMFDLPENALFDEMYETIPGVEFKEQRHVKTPRRPSAL